MQRYSLIIMDLDSTFLYKDYQKKIIDYCRIHNLRYGFITSRDYKTCCYPVNITQLYSPLFLCSDSGNKLHFKTSSVKNALPAFKDNTQYRLDENYAALLDSDWPGTELIKKMLNVLDDCELVASSEHYLSYYVPGDITLNVAEYILSAFNVSVSYSSKLFLEIFPAAGGQKGCLDYLAKKLAIDKKSIIIADSLQHIQDWENTPYSQIFTSSYKKPYHIQTKKADPDCYYASSQGSCGIYEGLRHLLSRNVQYCN